MKEYSKKVLIIINTDTALYKFRKELVSSLIKKDYKIVLDFPYNNRVDFFKKAGCTCYNSSIKRRSISFKSEIKLIDEYRKVINIEKPDLALFYTIKPNIYGGLICTKYKIPFIASITGLGSMFFRESIIKKITCFFYKKALKKAKSVFFQNKDNLSYFIDKKIVNENNAKLVQGSGVNINEFQYITYPSKSQISFLYVGRIMKEKGIDELLEMISFIKQKYITKNISFTLLGKCEENYNSILKEYINNGWIGYLGEQKEISGFYKNASCIILPTYHEGMSNALLEAAACGRPVLASNIPGCQEAFDEGITGFGFEPRNVDDLVRAIEKFIALPYEDKKAMGIAGRKKMEQEFDRQIVVDAYMEEIENILKNKHQ